MREGSGHLVLREIEDRDLGVLFEHSSRSVHCPPETKHAFVGAGDGACVLLCASSRQFQKDGPWGFYCTDETAARHNAASPEDTQDGSLAYARFPPSREIRYPGGLPPD